MEPTSHDTSVSQYIACYNLPISYKDT